MIRASWSAGPRSVNHIQSHRTVGVASSGLRRQAGPAPDEEWLESCGESDAECWACARGSISPSRISVTAPGARPPEARPVPCRPFARPRTRCARHPRPERSGHPCSRRSRPAVGWADPLRSGSSSGLRARGRVRFSVHQPVQPPIGSFVSSSAQHGRAGDVERRVSCR